MRDEDIAKVLDVSVATVEQARCAVCEDGLEVAVHGWPPHRKVPRTKLDGWAEAHLVAATCSSPPEGAARWTLKLLGDHLVGLGLVSSVSKSDHWQSAQKIDLKPWQVKQWCLPPQGSAAFVCAMEEEHAQNLQPPA